MNSISVLRSRPLIHFNTTLYNRHYTSIISKDIYFTAFLVCYSISNNLHQQSSNFVLSLKIKSILFLYINLSNKTTPLPLSGFKITKSSLSVSFFNISLILCYRNDVGKFVRTSSIKQISFYSIPMFIPNRLTVKLPTKTFNKRSPVNFVNFSSMENMIRPKA